MNKREIKKLITEIIDAGAVAFREADTEAEFKEYRQDAIGVWSYVVERRLQMSGRERRIASFLHEEGASPLSRPAPEADASRKLHQYKPDPKYPWFCADCGYAEHERLMPSPVSRPHQPAPKAK